MAVSMPRRLMPPEIKPKRGQKSPTPSVQPAANAPKHPQLPALPTLAWAPGQHRSTIEYDWTEACYGCELPNAMLAARGKPAFECPLTFCYTRRDRTASALENSRAHNSQEGALQ